ncbi:MAG: PA2169 family four-helix-bundle protein [Acidobacteria bacterium]|nr:PA2169 family four-helix-bundle protein [Acidobacteriota bacterium]
MTSDEMNRLLRSELSAVETYQQALDKEREKFGHDAEFQQLNAILAEHQQAASQLTTQIQQLGGTPVQDSGAWGMWSKIVMATAKLMGDKAALKALKEGEESGLKEYQEALHDTTTPSEVRTVLNSLLPKQQAHIRTLDGLMAKL